MDKGELFSGCSLNLKLEEPLFSQTREKLLKPPLCHFNGLDALTDHTVAQQNDCSRNCLAIVKFLSYNLFKKINVCYFQQLPSQPPHSRLTQVAPHTPPRRERDTDDHPPSSGALTPQQVGQLSRMLGLFSGPGQPQFSAEQLYAYLKGVQDK